MMRHIEEEKIPKRVKILGVSHRLHCPANLCSIFPMNEKRKRNTTNEEYAVAMLKVIKHYLPRLTIKLPVIHYGFVYDIKIPAREK